MPVNPTFSPVFDVESEESLSEKMPVAFALLIEVTEPAPPLAVMEEPLP
jgi:hypothetical protein